MSISLQRHSSLWNYKLPSQTVSHFPCACSSEWLHVHSLGQPHCWCCSWYTWTAGRGSWVTPVFFWNGCHCHEHAHLSQKWRPRCEFEVLEQDMMLVRRLMDSKFYICKITMFLLLLFQLPFPLPDALFLPFPSPPFPIDPLSFLPLFPSLPSGDLPTMLWGCQSLHELSAEDWCGSDMGEGKQHWAVQTGSERQY